MLQPFITFQGNAAEAADFYEDVFWGTGKEIMRWGEMPPSPDGVEDCIYQKYRSEEYEIRTDMNLLPNRGFISSLRIVGDSSG